MRTEKQSSSSSDLRCILCKKTDETDITGPLSCKQDTTAHQNCLLYASGIYCKNSPCFDDLFGFDVEDVENEARRGRKLKCCFCGKTGATSGCEVKSCKRSYHFPCAHKDQAVLEEDTTNGIFKLYCAKHNPKNTNVGSKKDGDGKEKDAKVVRFSSEHRSSETNEQNNSPQGSEGSDSDTPRRSQGRKRTHVSSGSEDETQCFIDMEMAPIESETEDNTPPKKNTPAFDSGHRSTDHKKPRQGFASADEDSDSESKCMLKVYREDRVPFTVIADSGPSVESVAENSSDPFSSAPTSPAGACLSNVDQSSVCASAALPSNTTVPPNPHLPARPSLDFSPPGTSGESCRVKESMCKDVIVNTERCASQNEPRLQMSLEVKLPGSHKHLHDHPLDLTSPGGCCMVHAQISKPVAHVGVLDSDAALFWMRCNEVGCTEDIFTDLTRQLSSLAEKVKNQHATQQDYAVSLRILEASGRLPAIFKQMEQDFEDQEKQLQRKKQALKDAQAVLQQKQFN
ncbi:hypothetical protein KOW79_005425 [Hemibagrus wyckioides]|uniref:PHD-type domain-containing protein n=1 Tax=Hemibagrus wyckioides TaxID=337641 RepID=A0A9D3NZN1_9TELE|nr:uncharacterized protein phf11 isoform X2 [Hemibagrus wyckioides]KAG7331456.1 hypothetical protein KOW79_005425 [Hemibagrus wyckioides]